MQPDTKADDSGGADCKSQLCQQTLINHLHFEPVLRVLDVLQVDSIIAEL